MSIPDPIEIMESRMERMMANYVEGECMQCHKQVGEDNLHCVSPIGDGPAICHECIGDVWKFPYVTYTKPNGIVDVSGEGKSESLFE